ncbi:hypothetical protein HME9302_01985 [Alteripontixanthobacter maritimus]|uniref:Uncharacterized protein n=1 Tax=Alteripontixanthobacter maritimus TaxID=2161824 RepID=A0A369QCX4_9SPHN|nr:hypothetical protein [Alteripontixanthobacter maritimus]RDC60769.1 hypothetical protein HME9302_01985 [Alteripontixanthobacter maritimus]
MKFVIIRFLAALRDGFALWWLAPLVPLIVVIPEFVQHIAEIELGMFASAAAFSELAQDPTRLMFGSLKLIGLLLAILAALRFFGAREQGLPWWNLHGVLWGRLLVSLVLLGLAGVPGMVMGESFGTLPRQLVDIVLTIATLPLLTWLVSAIIGDREMTFARIWTAGWLPALRIAVFMAVVFAPLQLLHMALHDWALGAASWLVWALMVFDAAVVGLMATMVGSAAYHGYSKVLPTLPLSREQTA